MLTARITVGAIALALTAACAPHAPADPAPASMPRVTANTPPDSLASGILRSCGRLGGTRDSCVERALTEALDVVGLPVVMSALDRMAERDANVRSASHGLAHGLGIAAYRSPETVAALFASCPVSQIGGCYHGVIQGYFLDVAARTGDVRKEDLDGLCAPHVATPMLYFQCAHGMGHGLMALRGNDLPRALAGCDLIAEPGARDSCYGGVFMENVVAEAHPHNTAAAHAALAATTHAHSGHEAHPPAADEHAGHMGAEHAGHAPAEHAGHAASTWRPLDRTDPLYPCNAVGQPYQLQCWLFQTSAMLAVNGGSLREAGRACAGAPADMVSVCYRSLGRDVTAFASRDAGRTAELCADNAPGDAEIHCVRGAAESIVNIDSKPEDGLAFCRVVAGDAKKAACYRAVGSTIPGLVAEHDRRAALCAAAEADYVSQCRDGAMLIPREAEGR